MEMSGQQSQAYPMHQSPLGDGWQVTLRLNRDRENEILFSACD